MANLDATGLSQLMVRLQLVSDEHIHDALDEIDSRAPTPEQLVKVLERKGHLSAFQGMKLLKGDTDGYFLGGYKILYKIAAGSFGRVYRAEDPRTGSSVAVKVLRRRWMEDAHKVELFEREGKVGLTLRHPNIVQILAVNRDPVTGQYYLVMEFVEGSNLRDFLSIRKKLDLPTSLRILEESSAGLAYAYSRGLSHRDIKASNILLDTNLTAKLVDFGLAELTGEGADEDDTTVDRTVDYAGLEKATGVKTGDPRSDIYFLGCVFYEMFLGKPYLSAPKDRYQRMARSRFEPGLALKEAADALPPQVMTLLERMVAYEPSQRFPSAAMMYEKVQAVARDVRGEGGAEARKAVGPKAVFVVESVQKFQDAFREKLSECGYRVMISIDGGRAVQIYKTKPFHAIIVNAGAPDVGEEGVRALEAVLQEAEMTGLDLAAILMLKKEQTAWADRVRKRENVAVMVLPFKIGALLAKLGELVDGKVAKTTDDE